MEVKDPGLNTNMHISAGRKFTLSLVKWHFPFFLHYLLISHSPFVLNPSLYHPRCRKLLEGEETRIGTGITYPSPSISAGVGQGYNYQSRIYTSSGKSTKKEGKDEDQQQQQSKTGAKVSQREVYEETVVTTKKMEKQQDSNDIPTNQKN